ncbi:DUF1161 domain-containing protein [Variovorax dokdonensis]|uniref:DUF1161 domain-containing protein n=1 Tax=Variovorax dokdonensis TaxID=344883 RepID=A0ABT7NH57_9BURK|nr:DUF1161 domain-containing protein [Variovorax dokdonensis]MDM0047256.1 DUF1161 domain-containing protein [Variovorax dokdonensis]
MTQDRKLALRLSQWALVALVAMLALANHAFAQADSCESIRAQIESKIAASGVTQFTVTVVDADDTSAKGQTVGTCGLGTRRIVYDRQTEAVGTTGAAAPAPRAASPILTECRDGSTPVNGVCAN